MNDETNNATVNADWDGQVHTATPQPKSTHDNALPVVTPTVTQAELAPLILFYFVNGVKKEWACSEPPPQDMASLIAMRLALGNNPTFNQRVNLKTVRNLQNIVGLSSHAAEQAMPIIYIDAKDQIYDQQRHAGRSASRAYALAKLEELLTGDALDTTAVKSNTNDPLLIKAISDAYRKDMNGETPQEPNIIPALLHVARKNLVTYATEWFRNWERINPQDRIEEIKIELSVPGSMPQTRIEQLHDELAKLESPAASEVIAQAAKQQIYSAYMPVLESVLMLLDELTRVLEKLKGEAISSEKSFFSLHGVPYERTGVSKRFDAAIKGTKDMANRLSNLPAHVTGPMPPHPAQTPITGIFGLEIPGLS